VELRVDRGARSWWLGGTTGQGQSSTALIMRGLKFPGQVGGFIFIIH